MRLLLTAIGGCIALTGCATPKPLPDRSNIWQEFTEGSSAQRPFVDFSHAGAFYGERALPDLADLRVFKVADFGALADDNADDTRAIQRAIDAAETAGGGVVQLGSGRYLLNSDPSVGALQITASRIVLRGEGQSATELHMVRDMPPAEPGKKWTGPAMIQFKPPGSAAPTSGGKAGDHAVALASGDVISIGEREVPLADASGFQVGDYVLFTMQSTAANSSFLQGKSTRTLWRTVNEQGVAARETQRIAEVRGNTLVLDRPLLTPLDPALPWRAEKLELLEQVGVQDLTFSATWDGPFVHHKDARHDSGYRAIELANTVDSWVANTHFRSVSTAVSVRGGMAASLLLNSIDGNGGHFSFQVEFATRTLVGMSVDAARGGQWHGPGASHMSVGTAIWRYLSPTSRGIDAHGLFPRHTLIDNATMDGFGGWGGNTRNLPNHLGGLVIWNFTQTGSHVGNHFDGTLDFWKLPDSDDKPYGFFTAVNPVLVGYRGPVTRFNEASMRLEKPGEVAMPRSLYEAQLEHRLGELPQWIVFSQSDWDAIVEREYDTDAE